MAGVLVAGLDYPRNRRELREQFGSPEQCRDFITRLRFPSGWVCPACGSSEGWWRSATVRRCRDCLTEQSVLAGTIFERTRTPLPVWFEVGWAMATAKNGLGAVELRNDYGIGSYETAWAMLHRYRRAMVFADRTKLRTRVEVDETLYGGRRVGQRGGRGAGRVVVVIAVEVASAKNWGRVRLGAFDHANAKNLHFFVQDSVERGATVMTDAWTGYAGLSGLGYVHQTTSLNGTATLGHEALPAVHQVASLLKRWLLGTHQGRVAPRQLQAYLDEFAFRFNRRRAAKPGLLFHRLIEGAVAHRPVTYDAIAAGF